MANADALGQHKLYIKSSPQNISINYLREIYYTVGDIRKSGSRGILPQTNQFLTLPPKCILQNG